MSTAAAIDTSSPCSAPMIQSNADPLTNRVAPAQDLSESMPVQQSEAMVSETEANSTLAVELPETTAADSDPPCTGGAVAPDLQQLTSPPQNEEHIPECILDSPAPVANACPPMQSRVEALIEQQNLLMQRQLQLAEENSKHQESVLCHYRTPKEFLKGLDPSVRTIFGNWRKKFCSEVRLYVEQGRLSLKYKDLNVKGELMKPFSQEARKRWEWPEFYRAVAKPIAGNDASSPDADGSDGNGEALSCYNVESAFMELRQQHAWEMQNFVIAHQKSCMEKVVQHLALPSQIHNLEAELDSFMSKNACFYDPQAARLLKRQAKAFVELVHREEMTKSEMQLKEDVVHSNAITTLMRVLCIVTVLLAAATMSHELLTRLFAILFALGCGIALLWEDLVMCSLHLLLGETVRRLRLLGGSLPRVPSTSTLEAVWSPAIGFGGQ